MLGRCLGVQTIRIVLSHIVEHAPLVGRVTLEGKSGFESEMADLQQLVPEGRKTRLQVWTQAAVTPTFEDSIEQTSFGFLVGCTFHNSMMFTGQCCRLYCTTRCHQM